MTIAGFDATLERIALGDDEVALWRVADIERHVDRTALLASDDGPEPPYWAHLWSGALVLAAAVPRAARVLEVGCGLGLPGLVAARRGARVVFVDRVAAPLSFVRASLSANHLDGALVVADAAAPALRGGFDLVLVAELLYDRAAFGPLAAALRAALAPGGRVLLADAGRIDTSAFYAALPAAGLAWSAEEQRVQEEGFPLTVRLVELCADGEGSVAWRAGAR
jgi:predicted nicotinamide N-methyase